MCKNEKGINSKQGKADLRLSCNALLRKEIHLPTMIRVDPFLISDLYVR